MQRLAQFTRKHWRALLLVSGWIGFAATAHAILIGRRPSHVLEITPATVVLTSTMQKDQNGETLGTCELMNIGAKPIRITALRTSCSCTVASGVAGTVLKPGDRKTVTISAQVPSSGKQQSAIFVETDPPQPSGGVIRVELVGEELQVPYIRNVPRVLQLIASEPGETVVEAIDIVTVEEEGSEPWLTGLSCDRKDVEVQLADMQDVEEVHSVSAVARRYTFTVSLRAPDTRGAALAYRFDPLAKTSIQRGIDPIALRVSVAVE